MYKYHAQYTDFDGNPREEDFYFNLTRAEALKIVVGKSGGFERWIQQIIDAQDGEQLYDAFEKIILTAYGEKSLNGREFIKSQEVIDRFKSTQAYSDLIMRLLNDSTFAAEFLNSIAADQPQKVDKKPQAAPQATSVVDAEVVVS